MALIIVHLLKEQWIINENVMVSESRKIFILEKLIFNKLIECGYPESSIVVEGKLLDKVYLDFIVNDLDTGLSVMIIKVEVCDIRTINHFKSITFNNSKMFLKSVKYRLN